MHEDDDEEAEPAVFLGEELAAEESEGEDEEESIEPEAQIVRRARRRVRFCLEGCDCERVRGRKCECERRSNGLCGLECKCDKSKCRTTVKDSDDDSLSEDARED
jgi:hypothetical protein